jgi:hypothetical protein
MHETGTGRLFLPWLTAGKIRDKDEQSFIYMHVGVPKIHLKIHLKNHLKILKDDFLYEHTLP